MLTGKSFEEALKVCFRQYPENFSMNIDEMERALCESGLETRRLNSTPKRIAKNTLIECRHRTQNYWHYIVYDAEQETFLDPIPDPPRTEEYEFYQAIEIL